MTQVADTWRSASGQDTTARPARLTAAQQINTSCWGCQGLTLGTASEPGSNTKL